MNEAWLDLFTVLVGDNGTLCSACVCTKNYSVFEDTADDRGASAGGLW